MTIKGFHHAAISTPNLGRCIDFYTRVIGGELAYTFGWNVGARGADEITGIVGSAANVAMLKVGNSCLEVFEFIAPAQPERAPRDSVHEHGITHICFEVTDIDAEYERLKSLGMTFKCAPKKTPDQAMVYGHDPDGNVVELIEFLSE